MVSFSVRKIRKNIIKSNFVLFALLFAISCSDSSNTEQKIDKQKTYNWSLVTTWPKNYPDSFWAMSLQETNCRFFAYLFFVQC